MKRSIAKIHNVADARSMARKAIPPVLFDYVDSGADDEVTLRENRLAFESVSFRPRSAVRISKPELATTVLGTKLSLPVILAPVGATRLVYPDGDRIVAQVAESFGTISIMSSAAATTLEDVAVAPQRPGWFQLYFRGDPDDVDALVDRVDKARFGALFVTIDTAANAQGGLERVHRHNAELPLRPTARNAFHFAPQLLPRPQWTYGYIRDRFPQNWASLPSQLHTRHPGQVKKLALATPTWDDIKRIRSNWKRPLVIKGVLTAEDARRSMECGADGVVISNHGGRQLDGSPATLRALPEIRAAIGESGEVIIDSGIRRGTDVVKALALGADATMIGRAYAYGLGAAGKDGVNKILEIFRNDIARTLGLLGISSVQDIDSTSVDATRL